MAFALARLVSADLWSFAVSDEMPGFASGSSTVQRLLLVLITFLAPTVFDEA